MNAWSDCALGDIQIDPRKAERILADEEVQQAIAAKRKENPDFLVFQEAFSAPEELISAKQNGSLLTVSLSPCDGFIPFLF